VKVLVTGSSGHLGEALFRTRGLGHEIVGLDMLSGPYTTCVGSVTDRDSVRQCMSGVEWVLHTVTLHRPHVDSHGRQALESWGVSVSGSKNFERDTFYAWLIPQEVAQVEIARNRSGI
jgi:UDP-glucose 4-epimerase